MKKRIFLLIIATFIFLANYAQNEFLDYIVTKNNDTIYGKINTNISKLTDVNGTKHKLKNIFLLRKNDIMFYKEKKGSFYSFEMLNSDDIKGIKKKKFAHVSQKKQFSDYIVTFENDTIYGKITKNLNYRARLENELGKKIMISTKVIKMYHWNNYFYYNKKKVAVRIGDRKKTFLKLVLDGKIKLFEYEIVGGGFALASSGNNNSFIHNNSFETELYYFLEVDGKLKIVQKHRFLKNMIKILKNESDLIKRLKKREFDYSNMYLLVKEYNSRN